MKDVLSLLRSAGGPGVLYQKDVLLRIRNMVRDAGSQKAVAGQLKVSAQYLNDVLSLRRAPGEKILKALNLKALTIYYDAKK